MEQEGRVRGVNETLIRNRKVLKEGRAEERDGSVCVGIETYRQATWKN